MYGPLSSIGTVDNIVCPSESEASSTVGAKNSAVDGKQVDSLLQPSEPACVSEMPRQNSAEDNVSGAHHLSLSDCCARSASGNEVMPSKNLDITSESGNEMSDIAKEWSTGSLVTDGSGKSVEVSVLNSLYCREVDRSGQCCLC